jgi:hypothetical protein
MLVTSVIVAVLRRLPSIDLQKALKLEPNNEAVKAELSRVDELIVSRKGKTVRRSIRFCRIFYAPSLRIHTHILSSDLRLSTSPPLLRHPRHHLPPQRLPNDVVSQSP